ncbi:hypothetical protein BJ875DRAFT_208436 [Amylocarpus encephaloides]|uniref:U4/U6.U5 small nuclear ribonucleoprotein 27kDa protein domain-containing protein n=1 Tax=Amylocarpus encephaloides TaxID=45428 RepID=A0A9P8C097_9HELO|nr:hypothetical protein BJ875DRAFT_208436 [Amylocarpus encephaloides]
MAEPPFKRARRPDSKQMWDEQDRRAHPAPLPSRERDEPRREDRRDDRRGDDRRRYRSRSPRRDDRDRDHGERSDDRDSRDYRGDRPGGRRDDDRNRNRDRDGYRDRDRGRASRDKPKERSRERRHSRSRSPRRQRARDERRDAERELRREDREQSKSLKPEGEYMKSRTATPPVSFKVGTTGAQDHDRMEIEGSRKGKDKSVEETFEDDDDEIVIEDDGMAAMQAMMGIGGFGTTHQKQVAGNDISAVRKEKKTEYRQYMNRVGGFNRPLSPTREA